MDELNINDLMISPKVIDAIVTRAIEDLEGVAMVGRDNLTTNVLSLFGDKSEHQVDGIESHVVDNKLHIHVGIAVFFGYKFEELADTVRKAVTDAIKAQVGVEVGRVDVSIDSMLFPRA